MKLSVWGEQRRGKGGVTFHMCGNCVQPGDTFCKYVPALYIGDGAVSWWGACWGVSCVLLQVEEAEAEAEAEEEVTADEGVAEERGVSGWGHTSSCTSSGQYS